MHELGGEVEEEVARRPELGAELLLVVEGRRLAALEAGGRGLLVAAFVRVLVGLDGWRRFVSARRLFARLTLGTVVDPGRKDSVKCFEGWKEVVGAY